jgi:hypothetical protein
VLVIVIEEIGQDYAIRMVLADFSGPRTSMVWLCLSIWSIPDVMENRTSNLSAIVSFDYDYDDEHEHDGVETKYARTG